MASTIYTNVVSLNAQRNLALSGQSLSTTMQRLSSGLRVNSAKDDAAGLAIADRMNTQVRGLSVASRNVNDGISLAQTAEGSLGSIGDMLQRIRELAVQASNATNGGSDRKNLQDEVAQLTAEIDRLAKQTKFNGQKVLDGSFAGAVFQAGANSGESITLDSLVDARADQLSGVTYGTLTRTQNPAVATKYTESIPAGTLQILGKNGLVDLGAIPPASSGMERLGQVVAAINATNDQHGVTAYLSKVDGSDNVKIDFMSDGTTPDGYRLGYNAVEFFGFTPQTTGVGPTYPDAADHYLKDDFLAPLAEKARSGATGSPGSSAKDLQSYLDFADTAKQYPNGLGGPFPDPHNANMTSSALADARTAYVKAVKAAVVPNTNGPDEPNDRLDLSKANAALDNLARTYRVAVLDSNIKEETGMGIGSNSGAANERGVANIDISTQKGAWIALKKLDSAVDQVSTSRAKLGAMQNRFEKAVNSIDVQTENLSTARGRIIDADFAAETANLARAQILQQAGTAMVAQANQMPQNVLKLLQG
ncbi:flagellin N-terminal helical domain-containing protein [Xylophilus sp. ASV27]|uniref:flagellin N-terminal helical domain-containing protein n=1 Tax=Xylophilus sp. ASV27 TaxID=2795129 RepID=UPI001E58007C|nr:flagellin [Xylophilus sp. ASV27]